MGIPCVNDTCSITALVDVNGRLNLNSRLSPTGGISCVDGQGLSLNIFGSPTPNAGPDSTCNNLLGVTTSGQIFASKPQAQVVIGTPTTRVNFLADTNPTAISSNITVTNNTACEKLLLIKTLWVFNYGVVDACNYSTDFSLVVDINGQVHSIDENLGGYSPGNDPKAATYELISPVFIPASSSIYIHGYGAGRTSHRIGPDGTPFGDETVGIVGQGITNGVANGLRVFHDLVMADLDAVSTMFTVS